MANHASALKRERQAQKRRMRNRSVLSATKTVIKKVQEAITSAKTREEGDAALKPAVSALHRAASKGVIPMKRAARKISRLAKHLRALPASSQTVASA